MSTSFECPRCQHRFVDASDADQAFAECPQCGSLALPGAMVSSTDSRVLKSVSGQGMLSDEGLPTSDDADPTVAIPIPGVFSALLDADVSSGGGTGAPSSGGEPLHFNDDTSAQGELASFEDGPPTTESEVDAAKKLPMSLLLTRGVSAEGAPALDDDDPSLPTLPSLPSRPSAPAAPNLDGPPPMSMSLEGSSPSLPRGVAPAPLFGDATSSSDELSFGSGTFDTLAAVVNPPKPVEARERAPAGDRGGAVLPDLDLGDLDIDLNLAPPIHHAPVKRAPPAQSAARALTHVPAGFDATDEGAAISDDRTTELRTTASSEGRALTLSELEARLGGGGVDVAQIFSSPGMIQEETFGALEQAFDEVSRRPPSRPPKRDRVQAIAAVSPPVDEISLITLRGGGDVPAPPAKPTVPTTKLRRRGELPHLSLSDEAISLAAYRIGETERSGPGRNAPSDLDTDELPAHLSEPTDLVRPLEARRPLEATITDVHAAPRSARSKARLLDDESEKKSVFTAGRVFVLAIVMGCAGVAAGAATAPPSPDDEPSARMNAIKQVAAGNRFFDEGRYDEALGAYRGALNSDRNYVQAHRAKAIALVKQRRYDEAAKAYEEYLAVSDDASDAELVKEILYRYNAGGDTP